MKQIAKILTAVLLFTSLGLGQSSITDEAKTKIATKHHNAMVRKAAELLKRKASLEAQLAENAKALGDIDSGKDQVEPPSTSSMGAVDCRVNCYTDNGYTVVPVRVDCDPDK
jgi:hypothetical protein